jgi:GNAT superfamily N-acetyltransferase
MSDEVNIRRDLRAGDLGKIVAHHGRQYAAEYGVDSTFEAMVAASVARAGSRGFPGPREGLWLVELEGELYGSMAYTDEGDGTAMVRWVLLDPALRGRGLARRILDELLAEVESHGFSRVCLETFSDLRVAAHLYLSRGFEVVSAEIGPRWGRAEITYQRYELELPRPTENATAEAAVADPA